MNNHLLERLDSRLKEFISTEELPYGGGLMGPSDKPNFPSLYLSRSTDPGLMKLPGEGSAMVRYKVKRREIDESREDGQPLYGASIEIQEIEPVEEEEEEVRGQESGVSEELASTLFLKEFGSGGWQRMRRVEESLQKKLRKSNAGMGEWKKTLSPLRAKMGGKLQSGGARADKRPDFGMRWNEKLRKVSDEVMGRGFETLAQGLREFGFYPVKNSGKMARGSLRIGNLLPGKVPAMAMKGKNPGEVWRIAGGTPDVPKTLKIHSGKRPEAVKQQGHRIMRKVHDEFFRVNQGPNPKGATLARAKSMKKRRDVAVMAANRKLLSSTLFLRQFAEARDRDGEGRFAAGNVPGPQDYAIAQAMAKRKKATSMAGNIARNARGRVVM